MIEIKNLSFAYKKNKYLFDGLNLNLQKGKVYGLLGKNGAGKTTLLKQTAGMLFPHRGSIKINDEDIKKRTVKGLENYYFLPEEFEMPNLSISSYVKINSPFYKNFDVEKFNYCIDEFKLPKSNKLDKMSYGQKKKALISFALASQTPILFADEPTNGLDIPSKSIFRKLMAQSINQERLFVISTHQIKDIEGIIDAIVVVDNGQVIFNESLDKIAEKLNFKTIENIDNENVIYSEKQFNQFQIIEKNQTGEPSRINLEILFNALINEDTIDSLKNL